MTAITGVVKDGSFEYNGRIYPYFDDSCNMTRITERAVEIPIALDLFNHAVRPLEVGAVLPQYLPSWGERAHEVIDLYEIYPDVVNADVLTFEAFAVFDLVICISTLDHLNSADEVRTAVSRMKSWLVPGGVLFATVPHGQPPEIGGGSWLDELVLSGELDMHITRMDKVDPHLHIWGQRPLTDAPRAYNSPSAFANTVYLMEWKR